ncbi:MAG: transposase [Burkholderiaceae bacterium]
MLRISLFVGKYYTHNAAKSSQILSLREIVEPGIKIRLNVSKRSEVPIPIFDRQQLARLGASVSRKFVHRRFQSARRNVLARLTNASSWRSCYLIRSALSDERVLLDAAGQVELKLKTFWRDGTTHLMMSPLTFMQRLAALVL